MANRKQALGRGLGALLSSQRPVAVQPSSETETPVLETGESSQPIRYLSLDQVQPNPHQPRKTFSEESLQELSFSIREHGVLQPILVTPKTSGDGYTLVAGERRFRAAQRAELTKIPALVQELSEEEMLEIAIVENVQRDDLNSVEEARAYRSLIDNFGWSQEQVAQRVGKNRSTVANSLRLLRLGDEALKDLEIGNLTAGHARAILAIDDSFYRQKLRQEIVEKGLSVREAERRAASYQKAGPPTQNPRKKSAAAAAEDLDTVHLEERLMVYLGCRVKILTRDGKSGKLEIPFRNPDELERFLQAIGLPE